MVSAILVAEQFYRDGLRRAVAAEESIALLAAVGASEAISAAAALRPDVVLIHLPPPVGTSLAAAVKGNQPSPCVVALGVRACALDAVAWARAGAGGCIGQESEFGDLMVAIEAVCAGGTWCSAAIGEALFRAAASAPGPPSSRPCREQLTPREIEIVTLLHHGLANKEIAAALQIQLPTVKSHVRSALSKLGARNRAEAAARWAARAMTEVHPRGAFAAPSDGDPRMPSVLTSKQIGVNPDSNHQ